MTEEEFYKVYERAEEICRMKCNHNNLRNALQVARASNSLQHREAVGAAFKRRNIGQECYDCMCAPDAEFMYKELKRLGGLK